MLIKKISLFIILSIIFFQTSTVIASTEECLQKITNDENRIKYKLSNDGNYFFSKCANDYPYLYMTITNLDDSHNKVRITHTPKVSNGYPLKTIEEHAKSDPSIVIAVNGYKWHGGDGKAGEHATSPTGTVYSNGKVLNKRSETGEVVLGFSRRGVEGTKAKLFDRSSGEIVDDFYKNNADNSKDSIVKKNIQSNADTNYRTSSAGIGKYDGKNILIILSANGRSVSLNEHYALFKKLGVTDALRLDGNSATGLYVNNHHQNPLTSYYDTSRYGSARHIMYSLTVSRVASFSKPQFENVIINNEVQFQGDVFFSGRITASKKIAKVDFEIIKPDGSKINENSSYTPENSGVIDMSQAYHFGSNYYVDQLGLYKLTVIATDIHGGSSSKTFNIEVLPKVDSILVSPAPVNAGGIFKLSVDGKKLTTDVKAYVLGGAECSVATPTNNIFVEFDCTAPSPARDYTWVVYYKEKATELDKKLITVTAPIECTSGQTEPRSCSIANATASQSRTCSTSGQWGDYGNCSITTCNNGYHLNHDESSCIVDTVTPDCAAGETQSCSTISNGTNTQACKTDGTWGSCSISCDSGYQVSGVSCVVIPPVQNCTPNTTQSQTCSISHGDGEKTRTCPADGSNWGNYGSCQVKDCDSGYEKSGNSCVEESVAIAIPTNVLVTASSGVAVIISWSEVANANGYEVRLVDRDGSDDREIEVSTIATLFSELTAGNRYKVRVRTKIGVAYGAFSDYEYFTIEEEISPVPTNLIANNYEAHTVNLNWDAVENASEYRIILDKINGGEWTDDTTTRYINYRDLVFNHEYRFKVQAKVGGSYGDYSPYKDFTVFCPSDRFSNGQVTEFLQYGDKDAGLGGSKTQVKQLQLFLFYMGYSPSVADGDFGTFTKSAVEAYQTDQGIDVDGKVGSITRGKINATCN